MQNNYLDNTFGRFGAKCRNPMPSVDILILEI
jgi:hypothetical protein